jgi:hypothetical protein
LAKSKIIQQRIGRILEKVTFGESQEFPAGPILTQRILTVFNSTRKIGLKKLNKKWFIDGKKIQFTQDFGARPISRQTPEKLRVSPTTTCHVDGD